jgi:predicted transcriptional regulator
MGHVLPGSRENYFTRNDPEEVRKEYNKINWSRDDTVYLAHEEEIHNLKQELRDEREKTESVSTYLDSLQMQIEALQKQLLELTPQRQQQGTHQ